MTMSTCWLLWHLVVFRLPLRALLGSACLPYTDTRDMPALAHGGLCHLYHIMFILPPLATPPNSATLCGGHFLLNDYSWPGLTVRVSAQCDGLRHSSRSWQQLGILQPVRKQRQIISSLFSSLYPPRPLTRERWHPPWEGLCISINLIKINPPTGPPPRWL